VRTRRVGLVRGFLLLLLAVAAVELALTLVTVVGVVWVAAWLLPLSRPAAVRMSRRARVRAQRRWSWFPAASVPARASAPASALLPEDRAWLVAHGWQDA